MEILFCTNRSFKKNLSTVSLINPFKIRRRDALWDSIRGATIIRVTLRKVLSPHLSTGWCLGREQEPSVKYEVSQKVLLSHSMADDG